MSGGSAERNQNDHPNDNPGNPLAELFERRLVFVMGKGGVGKTTISAALALAAERLGKRVLLAEIGDSDAIGQVFISHTLPAQPLKIADAIWGARVNPKAELAEYLNQHINSTFFANRITRSRLFDYLAAAAPGLKEIMSLGRIWRWVLEKDADGLAAYDLIIVDAPATGHALSLLRLPQVLIEMIRFGPIVREVRQLEKLIKDPEKTWLTLVTLAEELPVNEALQLYQDAHTKLGMPVKLVFINAVYPQVFSPDETAQIADLLPYCRQHDPGAKGLRLLEAGWQWLSRRRRQQPYIDQLADKISSGHMEIPIYFTSHLSITDIGDIAARLINVLEP